MATHCVHSQKLGILSEASDEEDLSQDKVTEFDDKSENDFSEDGNDYFGSGSDDDASRLVSVYAP